MLPTTLVLVTPQYNHWGRRFMRLLPMKRIVKRIEKCASLNAAANNYVKQGDYEMAVEKHMTMQVNSRVCFNIAMLYAALKNFEMASYYFLSAISLDPWLTIGYYFFALLYQTKGEYHRAVHLYNKAATSFRNHEYIDYHQLGVPLKLFKADVLKNTAVCHFRIGSLLEARRSIPKYSKENINDLLVKIPPYQNELLLFKRPSIGASFCHLYKKN